MVRVRARACVCVVGGDPSLSLPSLLFAPLSLLCHSSISLLSLSACSKLETAIKRAHAGMRSPAWGPGSVGLRHSTSSPSPTTRCACWAPPSGGHLPISICISYSLAKICKIYSLSVLIWFQLVHIIIITRRRDSCFLSVATHPHTPSSWPFDSNLF